MKIERILKVVDTRQYEEGPDDKWYPIVGSGHEHACARCGRMHEIHAIVLLDDGNEAVVGTGCASKENTEMAARFLRAENLAKRLARLNAVEAAFTLKMARWEKAWAEVEALPVPAVEVEQKSPVVGRSVDLMTWFRVGAEGYARVRESDLAVPAYKAERVACAVDGWRRARMKERGVDEWAPRATMNFKRDRARIMKAMASITEQASTAAPAILGHDGAASIGTAGRRCC